MDVWTAIITQRAVRRFDERPIPDEAIERILDAGRRAPSSTNDQPWEFVLVTERERLRRLARVGDFAGHLAGATAAIAFVTQKTTPDAHAADLYDLGHATQSMMLVALELGIGTVHASVYHQDLVREILGLPDDRRCDYLISLGYPAQHDLLDRPRRKVPRRPLAELLHREQW
jgi:nitroreductase